MIKTNLVCHYLNIDRSHSLIGHILDQYHCIFGIFKNSHCKIDLISISSFKIFV